MKEFYFFKTIWNFTFEVNVQYFKVTTFKKLFVKEKLDGVVGILA